MSSMKIKIIAYEKGKLKHPPPQFLMVGNGIYPLGPLQPRWKTGF